MANSTALPLVLLAEQFAKLPGIGMKTAQRLAYFVMGMSDEDAQAFADAIINAHSTVKELQSYRFGCVPNMQRRYA